MGGISNNDVNLEFGAKGFKDISFDSRGDSGCPSFHQRPSNAPSDEGNISRANPWCEPAPRSLLKHHKTMLLPGEDLGVQKGGGLLGPQWSYVGAVFNWRGACCISAAARLHSVELSCINRTMRPACGAVTCLCWDSRVQWKEGWTENQKTQDKVPHFSEPLFP